MARTGICGGGRHVRTGDGRWGGGSGAGNPKAGLGAKEGGNWGLFGVKGQDIVLGVGVKKRCRMSDAGIKRPDAGR
jgi:hypothetical protein